MIVPALVNSRVFIANCIRFFMQLLQTSMNVLKTLTDVIRTAITPLALMHVAVTVAIVLMEMEEHAMVQIIQ